MSAVAVLGSGPGTARGMHRLTGDLEIMLKSEGFLVDVARRQGSVANMEEPDTHLVDEAIKMGARIASTEGS